MSSQLRAAVASVCAVVWAAACGTADSVATPSPQCKIYFGGREIPGPPDGAALCPVGVCNFQTQEGCPATETCAPHYDLAQDKVVPACFALGPRKVGESCNVDAQSTCARGLVCAEGVCAKA